MTTEVVTALIGAAGTVVVAVIGAYATLTSAGSRDAPASPQVAAKRRRFSFWILSAGIVLAAVISLAGYGLGASEAKREETIQRNTQIARSLKSYQSLIAAGLKAGKPYIIPEAIMLIDLERSSNKRSIESDREMIYSLQMLADIKKEAPQFMEEYHSNYQVDRVAGIDQELGIEDSPGMKRWQVLFNADAGSRRLVMTAAHVREPLKLEPNHKVHMFSGLASNEDAFCYPNSDGDIFDELVIAIRSHSLILSLPGGGADDALLQHGNELKPVDAWQYSTGAGDHTHFTIVARFRNLQRDDVAGLRVRWQP